MKRYAFVEGHPAEMVELQDGECVLYVDVEPIVADRDIKAANLQLLVEKVLAYEDAGVSNMYEAEQAMLNLARSLKQ